MVHDDPSVVVGFWFLDIDKVLSIDWVAIVCTLNDRVPNNRETVNKNAFLGAYF